MTSNKEITSKIDTIEKYSKMARLWVIHFEREIEKSGSAIAMNEKKYTSIKELYFDIEKQLTLIVESKTLIMDITYEEALNILQGK